MPFYTALKGRPGERVPVDVRERVAERLLDLKTALDKAIPAHSIDDRALIATWNIREFDSVVGGIRGIEPLMYIAQVVSAFDLVAIQEVRDDLTALNRLLGYLGSWWHVLVSDVTRGQTGGNRERLAFVYDSRKVRFGGLVGEVVRPDPAGHPAGEFVQQFARTPFLVGFQVGWQKFTICTAHIYYGEGEPDPRRKAEIAWLAKILADQSMEKHAWAHNVLMLGDFNIFKPEEEAAQAIAAAGFEIPAALQSIHTDLGDEKHYDQIAWLKHKAGSPGYPIEVKKAGTFRWDDVVYKTADAAIYEDKVSKGMTFKTWRTYQMSDHRPLWVEITTDYSRDYLGDLLADDPQAEGNAMLPAFAPTRVG